MENASREALKRGVEHRFGRRLITDRYFRELCEDIFMVLGEMLSAATLKHLWGYLDEKVVPRRHTLSVLAQYAGYRDWDSFVSSGSGEPESGPVCNMVIDVSRELRSGSRLVITWSPGRRCEVEYLGNNRFVIIAAQGTRLDEGIIFECPVIIIGEPLYINIVGGGEPRSYVCGKQNGVRVEKDRKGLLCSGSDV